MGVSWSVKTGYEDARVLMLGLDNAGKTTILRQMGYGEVQPTIPTIGFNIETLKMPGFNLTIWDIGGQTKVRRLWGAYFKGAHAVIFVVDTEDRERLQEAKREFLQLWQNRLLSDAVFLVLCNKVDKPGTMNAMYVEEVFDLPGEPYSRVAFYDCSAVKNTGLHEAFMWLHTKVQPFLKPEFVSLSQFMHTMIFGKN